MTSSFLTKMADRVQRRMAPLLETMEYRPAVAVTFTTKLVAGVPAGSNTIALNNLSGLNSVYAGDTFTISPFSQKFTATNNINASGGVINGIIFTPATTAATTTGTAVTVTKTLSISIRALLTGFDQTRAANTNLVTATSVRVLVDPRTLSYGGLALRPGVGDKIVLPSGRILLVDAISQDGASAFHVLVCH